MTTTIDLDLDVATPEEVAKALNTIADAMDAELSPSTEAEWNARLIAAAPQMAEMLRDAVAYENTAFWDNDQVNAADLVEWFAQWRCAAERLLASLEGEQ